MSYPSDWDKKMLRIPFIYGEIGGRPALAVLAELATQSERVVLLDSKAALTRWGREPKGGWLAGYTSFNHYWSDLWGAHHWFPESLSADDKLLYAKTRDALSGFFAL